MSKLLVLNLLEGETVTELDQLVFRCTNSTPSPLESYAQNTLYA